MTIRMCMQLWNQGNGLLYGDNGKYESYYQLDSGYYFVIEYPVAVTDDAWANMDDRQREYWKAERPYSEKDIKELVQKVTSVILINKTEENNEQLHIKIDIGNVKLNDKISINMDIFKVITWHSGSQNIQLNKLNEKSTVINGYNSNNDLISIGEFRQDIEMDFYLSYFDLALKEYNYRENDIYIVYKTDSYFKEDIGKYEGIMFKIDNIWYRISGENSVSPTDINVDEWISNMCAGVVTFK